MKLLGRGASSRVWTLRHRRSFHQVPEKPVYDISSRDAHEPNGASQRRSVVGEAGSIRRPGRRNDQNRLTERVERNKSALRGGEGQSAVDQLTRDLLGADGEEIPAPGTSYPLQRVHDQFALRTGIGAGGYLPR